MEKPVFIGAVGFLGGGILKEEKIDKNVNS